ncbi:MAG: VaFE repeat-containing surface-anchored protein [Eubacterium sp.]|nr:VaFE repeat-containing surface-anchored protein [Eubacterium sp.]
MTNNIFKNVGKRMVAGFTAAVMAVMSLPLQSFAEEGILPTAVDYDVMPLAAGDTMYSDFSGKITLSDGSTVGNDDYYYIKYSSAGTPMYAEHHVGTTNAYGLMMKTSTSATSGQQVMCIEAGAEFVTGQKYVGYTVSNSSYWQGLLKTAGYRSTLMALATYYGYHGTSITSAQSAAVPGANNEDWKVATQVLLWELQQGLRIDATGTASNSTGMRTDLSAYMPGSGIVTLSYNNFRARLASPNSKLAYNWIITQMRSHALLPSFCATNTSTSGKYTPISKTSSNLAEVKMTWDASSKKYVGRIEDTNKTNHAGDFKNLTNSTKIDVKVVTENGKTYYEFSTTTKLNDFVTMGKEQEGMSGMVVYEPVNSDYQTVITGTYDPTQFYVKAITEGDSGGTANIQKEFVGATANPSMYMQCKFALRDSSGKYLVLTSTGSTGVYNYSGSTSSTVQSYNTSSSGLFSVRDLPAGRYTIIETDSPNGWSGASKTFTLAEGETKDIPFENTQDEGSAKIKKTFVSGSNLSSAELAALYGDIYFTIKASNGNYVYPTAASSTGSYTYSGTRTAEYKFMVNTSTGEFVVSKLPPGTYTITEINNAEGYRPATQSKTLTVSAGSTATATFTNTSVPTITIKKHFSDESNLTEEEIKEQYKKVKIKITNSYVPDTHTMNVTGSNGEYTFDSWVQGENWLSLSDNGEMTIEFVANFPPGTYTVYESYDGDEYELADPQTFSLSANPNDANILADIEIENVRKTGNVKVIKSFTDANGGNVLVSDEQISSVSFVITNVAGRELTFTGSNGNYQYSGAATRGTELKLSVTDKTLVAKNIPVGNYTISEVSGAEGFNFAVEEEHFTVLAADDTEINFVNEAMKGNLHIQKLTSDNVLAGWQFRVQLVESPFEGYTYDKTFTTDNNGEINISNLRIGTYKVTEVTTGVVGYITPEAQTAVIEDDETTDLFFTNVPIGNVHVTKVDRDYTDVKLTGAEFTVTAAADIATASGETLYSEGDIIGTLTETELGEYQLDDIPYGDYYLQETKAPENYVEDENIYSFSIREANRTIQVGTYGDSVFLNEPMSGKLHIQKHSADGVLENWQFRVELVSSPFEGYTYDHIFITSKDGGITIENLRIGTYRVTEVVTGDEAYITPPPKDVTIVFGSEHTVDMDNIPLGNVHVTKVDIDYPDNKLTGAEFTVYATDKETVVGKLTETSAGEYQLDDIRYGDYYLQETKAPANYVKDDNFYPFAIRVAGATVDVETKAGVGLENTPMTGTLHIKKLTSDNVLAGWQFRVELVDSPFTEDYTYDETFTTNDNGEINIENLRIGTYKVTEVTTGVEHYITPEAQTVTIEYNKTSDREFTNIPLGNVHVTKVDIDYPDNKLTGAEFTVTAAADIVDASGKKLYSKGDVVGKLTETVLGEYQLDDIPYGDYLLQETKAPANYVKDDNFYPFAIRVAGATVDVETKEQVGFENVPMKGHINIKKSSADGVISGWKFRVQLVESPFEGYTYDQTFTTDANGEIAINNLRIGTYKITEVVTGDEYYITPDAKDVTVGHNKITNVEFTNIPLGNVRVYKVDKDYPDVKLSGAEFTVYMADKQTVIGTLEEIEKGTYELQCIPYGNYFLKETKAPDNFVIDNNYYPFVIREAGETVVVGNVAAAVSLPVSKSDGNVTWDEQEYKTPQTALIIAEEAASIKYPAINAAVANEYPVGEDVTVIARLDNYYKLSDGEYISADKVQLNAAATDFLNDRYPEIGTTATVDGKKEIVATGTVTIKDIVSYKHLVPGNEYTVTGVLMDKATGKQFFVNGKPVTAETTFIAETENGETIVEFTFNADGLVTDTEIVVFETLYHNGIEIATHADIEDKGQTVTLRIPEEPENPTTGVGLDGLAGVIAAATLATGTAVVYKRKRK